jgi:hypothetical protein
MVHDVCVLLFFCSPVSLNFACETTQSVLLLLLLLLLLAEVFQVLTDGRCKFFFPSSPLWTDLVMFA